MWKGFHISCNCLGAVPVPNNNFTPSHLGVLDVSPELVLNIGKPSCHLIQADLVTFCCDFALTLFALAAFFKVALLAALGTFFVPSRKTLLPDISIRRSPVSVSSIISAAFTSGSVLNTAFCHQSCFVGLTTGWSAS